MGDLRSVYRKWDDMEIDVLVKIFKLLNIVDMGPVSQVCRLWRDTCSDPLIWRTLDITRLQSHYIKTKVAPYIYVSEPSDKFLFKVLKLTMAISRENVSCVILHYCLYLKDHHLSYITERCPHLRRLVMPAWNLISKPGISQAIRRLPNLESLTISTNVHPIFIIQEIGQRCRNLSELKIMCATEFNILLATAIVTYLPRLKILSLRCSCFTRDALLMLLSSAVNLEVLNISHSVILETVGRKQVVRKIDAGLLAVGSRSRMKVLVCQEKGCPTCQRMVDDEGLMRWHRYEGWFWRRDEVPSLDMGFDSGTLFDAEFQKLIPY